MFRLPQAHVQGLQVCLIQFPSHNVAVSVRDTEVCMYGRPIVGGLLLEGGPTWLQKRYLPQVLRAMQEW